MRVHLRMKKQFSIVVVVSSYYNARNGVGYTRKSFLIGSDGVELPCS